MATVHCFQPALAVQFGVNAAIIFECLAFWIENNKANGRNLRDGRYWTYNSVAALNELFPYLSAKAIRNALLKLEEEGIIIKGNYNPSAYDRTLWYALTEKGESICQKGQMDLPKRENGSFQKGKAIPVSYHLANQLDGSSSYSSEEETDFGAVMAFFLDRINPAPSTSCTGELQRYVDDLTAPVVLHALEIAVDNKHTAWGYIKGILQSYSRAGLRTLQAVLDEEQRYKESREKTTERRRNGESAHRVSTGRTREAAGDNPDAAERFGDIGKFYVNLDGNAR